MTILIVNDSEWWIIMVNNRSGWLKPVNADYDTQWWLFFVHKTYLYHIYIISILNHMKSIYIVLLQSRVPPLGSENPPVQRYGFMVCGFLHFNFKQHAINEGTGSDIEGRLSTSFHPFCSFGHGSNKLFSTKLRGFRSVCNMHSTSLVGVEDFVGSQHPAPEWWYSSEQGRWSSVAALITSVSQVTLW